MNSYKRLTADSSSAQTRANPFLRGFIDGTASLFDIFGVRGRRPGHGTPGDDARELRGDVERIAQDFHAVFASIDSISKKQRTVP